MQLGTAVGRALANQEDSQVIQQWWGRNDWESIRQMRHWHLMELVVQRFREELGYWSVKGWPIYATPPGGRTMYYLIHAFDSWQETLASAPMPNAWPKSAEAWQVSSKRTGCTLWKNYASKRLRTRAVYGFSLSMAHA